MGASPASSLPLLCLCPRPSLPSLPSPDPPEVWCFLVHGLLFAQVHSLKLSLCLSLPFGIIVRWFLDAQAPAVNSDTCGARDWKAQEDTMPEVPGVPATPLGKSPLRSCSLESLALEASRPLVWGMFQDPEDTHRPCRLLTGLMDDALHLAWAGPRAVGVWDREGA